VLKLSNAPADRIEGDRRRNKGIVLVTTRDTVVCGELGNPNKGM